MKGIINRAALNEALGVTTSVVASRTPKAVLQCVRLSAAEDRLVLLGTDLEVGVRFSVPQVEITEPGEALVPADKFSRVVRESADETLALEVADNVCHVRGRDSHFQIYGHDPREFPPVAELEGEPDLEIDSRLLATMVAKTVYAAARENTRYAINGVLWERKDKHLVLVATDGRRLAQVRGALSRSVEQPTEVIVPAKSMRILARVLDEGGENVAVKFAPNQVIVRAGPVVLSSAVVEGHFPKYDDVIPRDCDKKVELPTQELLSAVARAALLTSEDSKGVRIAFRADSLVFSSRTPDEGEATITMNVPYAGEALEIGFNPTFLVEALRVVDQELVTLEVKESNRPGLLRSGDDFVYVIMPVSLG